MSEIPFGGKTIRVELTSDLLLRVCDPESSVDDAPVEGIRIEEGQNVRWEFCGLPRELEESWLPRLVFPQGSPFAEMRQSPGAVEGLGNRGEIGAYPFTAVLQDWRAPRLSRFISKAAFLWQGAVSVNVEIDLGERTFEVTPKILRVAAATPVLWKFRGLPADYRPQLRFSFVRPKDEGNFLLTDSYFGPFEALSQRGDALLGTGTRAQGQYHYVAQVVSAEDFGNTIELVSVTSEDPVIDNEKDPAGGKLSPKDQP